MSLESIKTRIAKLLAKAEGTDNAAEAESFMAKVNALLEEHQIEMHEIRQKMANGVDTDPIGKQKGETNIYASMLWARGVASALARYYGCRYVYWKVGNHIRYEILGRESARTTFELMLPFILTQVRLQARNMDSGRSNASSRSVLERQVGQALEIRIWRMVRDADAQRIVLTGRGLVPFDNLDALMEDFFPQLKKARQRKAITLDAAAVEAAKKISLHHQAGGKPNAKMIGA